MAVESQIISIVDFSPLGHSINYLINKYQIVLTTTNHTKASYGCIMVSSFSFCILSSVPSELQIAACVSSFDADCLVSNAHQLATVEIE